MTSTPERHSSIKDSIERHPVVWFLGTLLAGFLAGLAAYDRVQEMAEIQPTTQAALDRMEQQRSRLEEDLQSAQKKLRQASEELKKQRAQPIELRNRVTELEQQNTALETKNSELTTQLAALRASRNATTPQLEQKITELEQEIRATRIGPQAALDELTSLKKEKLQLESRLRNLQEKNTSLTAVNKELLSKVPGGKKAQLFLAGASVLKGKRIKIRYIAEISEYALLMMELLKKVGAKVTLEAMKGPNTGKGSVYYADETFLEAALYIQILGIEKYFYVPKKMPIIAKQNLDFLVVLY